LDAKTEQEIHDEAICHRRIGRLAITTTFAVAEPATARSNVGVYVGPNGIGISVEQYRTYCRDDIIAAITGIAAALLRREYPNAYDRHEHGRYKHWDRSHRRWYWTTIAVIAQRKVFVDRESAGNPALSSCCARSIAALTGRNFAGLHPH